MNSKQASFDYAKFNEPQVSKAVLMQGFGITQSQWDNIAKKVIKDLNKHRFTAHHTFQAKACKVVQEQVRVDIIKEFPELSIHVPELWLKKGTLQIVRSVHSARKAKKSKTLKSRPFAGKASTSPLTNAIASPNTVSFDARLRHMESQDEPGLSYPSAIPAAHATSQKPAASSGDSPTLSNGSKDAHAQRILFDSRVVQFKTPDTSPAPRATTWEKNSKPHGDTPKMPSQITPAPNNDVHPDLKKIQLIATIAHDRTDSSLINLGELLLKNDRLGKAVSYSSLEDVTDEDWEYYCGTYLPSDLERGFIPGTDKIYFDNGGDEMVRVKNAANWRGAMVAMQEAGLTQFKFYIEQPVKSMSILTVSLNNN